MEETLAFDKWPFTQSELTVGLRRHTGDPRLTITRFSEREITRRLPAVGHLRGMEVHTEGITGKQFFHLVLKENMGSTRAGGAGAGLREMNVYLTLKELLPVRLPVLIASHPKGAWLVMIHLPPGRLPNKWTAADYLLATEQLAILHDRFWGLGEDLAVYPWLRQSLHRTRDIYQQAAMQDAHTLAQNKESLLMTQTNVTQITEKILENLDQIVGVLEASPATLLHGDYWPGNILIHERGGMTVFDWEDAGIGPATLDLLSFLQGSSWQFNQLPLPADEIIAHYRSQLSQAGAHTYTDDEFYHIWDHTLMWTFVTGWVGRLAKIPNSLLPMRLEALQEVLFTPINQAVERQLS
ncbi:MAG: phosphotransferase family protein [Anaerolineales bacterium]